MGLLTALGRLLHYVHPEVAHRLLSPVLSIPLPSCRCAARWRVGTAETCGPVGIAAGLDKTGMYARFLSFFCPGFIVVGSTLPRARRGNKPPRAARVRPYSLVNAMGLNTPGVAVVVSRVSGLEYPVFISLAGFSVRDFVVQVEYLKRHYRPAAVELNISSPTYGGSWRDIPEDLDAGVQVFVKVGPSSDLRAVIRRAARLGWGLVVTNTIPVRDARLSAGAGGLSGLLLYRHGVRLLARAREIAGPDVPIVYSGGVFACSQLREVLKLANAVEVLTSVLYFTPYVARLLNECPGVPRAHDPR
jgi:dihydroorotate dehydrogenase (fumarate)